VRIGTSSVLWPTRFDASFYKFASQNPVGPLSLYGTVTTILCPRIRNVSTMQSAETPVRFYSILWCSCPDSTRPVVRSNRTKTLAKTLLQLAIIAIAVYMLGPSSFPLTSRSWKSQTRTLILTCCIATEPRRTPNCPQSKVSHVRLRKYPTQNLTRSIGSGGPCRFWFWRLMVPFGTTIAVCLSSTQEKPTAVVRGSFRP
jgi:hypothetical protein